MKISNILYSFLLATACMPRPDGVQISELQPPIFPDYANVEIPVNIAPLSFMLADSAQYINVRISGNGNVKGAPVIEKSSGSAITFSAREWRNLMSASEGDTLNVVVAGRYGDRWVEYQPFRWYVKSDKIDKYLTYRLIEPGYEIWNRVYICERNLENYEEKIIADNNLTDNSCMNCHVVNHHRDSQSMFHLRGEGGGTIFNIDGKIGKRQIRDVNTVSNATYGDFHPDGRYVVFSTNIIIPFLHTLNSNRLEVFDTQSDLIVYDIQTDRIIHSPMLEGEEYLETFPTFSADGKSIIFCRARALPLPDSIMSLKYDLCSISFDAGNGSVGSQIETIYSSTRQGKSVSFPKCSPDGRFTLITASDYGTFPIWHREADMVMIDNNSGLHDNMDATNGPNSDSYHSWSSGSRWIVFASKRDDGLYGRPYIAYVGDDGKTGKPFLMPQKDPDYYHYMLKSYNIPEFSTFSYDFGARDINRIYFEKEKKNLKP